MTTITKERLLTIKQWRETYGPGSNVVLPAEEAEELARIALASLEAEPVGAFHIAEQQVDGTSDYLKDGEWPIDNGIIEVYAAPPVPVVPAALPENDDEDGHDIDYLEPSEVYALGRTAGWNACRAAMLHGKYEQPQNAQQNIPENIPGGNSPVTPDSWISCSERMPNDKQYVWCWGKSYGWTECNTFEGYYDWSRNKWWAVTDDGEEPASKVTHWMPIPEPPQEAK
ncbi:TPA: DUF551 domain-containing protein [Escherichia coli]|uniref:DUF551 domain-containing protein n=1 Tax=Escherichia coli TaxID=562 RepID=A0A0D8VD89_ECOLX|nr:MULTISPECIES: DUF551 domain-containing protein [Enterobacteriaceae]ANW31446.1 hypothetical protein BB405_22485 [Escherichia coli]EEU9517920.1 DUF551 domain-containing protein [Escherichia coli]EEV5553414.1 DUF551 domain-containing protein [Escherichia coli]EEW2143829.1 DUF551 domain-containing protein [Escherichia coli]EFB6148231.1 DUF551 domain-containing protein [Escherichia coli]